MPSDDSALVSAVVTTLDRAALLTRAADSVLAQTVFDLELIVVDDGSKDETDDVLASIVEDDARIRVIRHDSPQGAPAARNAGARAANGRFLAFLDDDCVWRRDKLELQLERMSDRGVGLVYCRQAVRDLDGRWIVEGRAEAAGSDPAGALLHTNYIGPSMVLVRRELFEAVGGFDESMPRLQDWDLWLRIARRTRFAFIPEVLVQGEMVAGGITSRQRALAEACGIMLDKHARPNSLTREQRAALHYGLGKFLLADGLTEDARAVLSRAVRLDPGRFAYWAAALSCLFGPKPVRFARELRRRWARKHHRKRGQADSVADFASSSSEDSRSIHSSAPV